MMTTRSVNETSTVALRDNAMAMLKQGGWHDDGKGHRLLIRETADLRIAYAGPLQMGAGEMTETMKYFAAAASGAFLAILPGCCGSAPTFRNSKYYR
jgi:hypothetical protein